MQSEAKTIADNPDLSAISQTDKDELVGIIEQKTLVISQQEKRIKILEKALRLARHKRFAPSSEQSHAQEYLFDEAEAIDEAVESESKPEPKQAEGQKKKTGRKPFSKNIPRTPVFINLSDEEKAGAIKTFYTKVREELDIVPAKVQILEYFQEKAIFADSEDKDSRSVKSAILPKHPLARSMGSINLISANLSH